LADGLNRIEVAVVLGAAKWFGGHPNLYSEARLDAAAALYQSLARGAAVLDVTLGRGPKYLGRPEHVLGS